MNNDELYHYGVPGMRWGHRKAVNTTSNAGKRNKNKTDDVSSKKKRVSKKTKIVIGSTITVAALAGVGTMLFSDAIAEKARTLTVGKTMIDNMW